MPIPQAAHYMNCPLHVLPITGVLLYFLLSKHSVKAGKIVLTLERYFSIIVCKVPCARHQSILGPAPGPSPRSRCCQSAATLAMVSTNILILHTLVLAACWGKLDMSARF